jgi:hypothetical protein
LVLLELLVLLGKRARLELLLVILLLELLLLLGKRARLELLLVILLLELLVLLGKWAGWLLKVLLVLWVLLWKWVGLVVVLLLLLLCKRPWCFPFISKQPIIRSSTVQFSISVLLMVLLLTRSFSGWGSVGASRSARHLCRRKLAVGDGFELRYLEPLEAALELAIWIGVKGELQKFRVVIR